MRASAVNKNTDTSLYTKKELITWIYDLLKIKVNNIEELSNGAVFCQILDIIGAETVRMQKINWNAKLQHQNLSNLKILSTTMLALGIDKKFDAQRISQKKNQDILQLLQWFRKYFVINNVSHQNYDPISRRRNVSNQKSCVQSKLSAQISSEQKIKLSKDQFGLKRQPDQIPQNVQLKHCLNINREIKRILKEETGHNSAEKKLELIKSILFSNSELKRNSNKSIQNSQISSMVTIPNFSSNRKPADKQIKIEEDHYNIYPNSQKDQNVTVQSGKSWNSSKPQYIKPQNIQDPNQMNHQMDLN